MRGSKLRPNPNADSTVSMARIRARARQWLIDSGWSDAPSHSKPPIAGLSSFNAMSISTQLKIDRRES